LVRGTQELVGTAAMEDLVRYVSTEAGRLALLDLVRTLTAGGWQGPSTSNANYYPDLHDKQL
jgi:hypothetical protein